MLYESAPSSYNPDFRDPNPWQFIDMRIASIGIVITAKAELLGPGLRRGDGRLSTNG